MKRILLLALLGFHIVNTPLQAASTEATAPSAWSWQWIRDKFWGTCSDVWQKAKTNPKTTAAIVAGGLAAAWYFSRNRQATRTPVTPAQPSAPIAPYYAIVSQPPSVEQPLPAPMPAVASSSSYEPQELFTPPITGVSESQPLPAPMPAASSSSSYTSRPSLVHQRYEKIASGENVPILTINEGGYTPKTIYMLLNEAQIFLRDNKRIIKNNSIIKIGPIHSLGSQYPYTFTEEPANLSIESYHKYAESRSTPEVLYTDNRVEAVDMRPMKGTHIIIWPKHDPISKKPIANITALDFNDNNNRILIDDIVMVAKVIACYIWWNPPYTLTISLDRENLRVHLESDGELNKELLKNDARKRFNELFTQFNTTLPK